MPSSFAGLLVAFALQASPANLSATASAGTPVAGRTASVTSPALAAPAHAPGSITTAHSTGLAGVLDELFGRLLFERIVILPSLKDLHFVLSATRFPLEVWNTFRTADKVLTAIVITGSGGLTLDAPVTLPHTILGMGSVIYQATLPASGSAAINQTVAFTITGVGTPSGTAIGTRIMVFSVRPDWNDEITETISDLCDVLTSYDNAEQRRGIRGLSRRGLKFTAKALDPRLAAGMESLIWGWQDKPYGVPFWQDLVTLTADAVAGDTSISVPTVDRLFAPGGLVLLYLDEFNFESLTIRSMTSGTLTFESPLIFGWKTGSICMPVFLGRLADSVDVGRLNSGLDEMQLEFSGEAGQLAAAPVYIQTQYKGFDVLEVPPNWDSDLKRTYARSLARLDDGTGPITVEDKAGVAIVSTELPWFLNGRQDATKLRAFLLARGGRLNPFWLPTWDQDLQAAVDVDPASSVLVVQNVFYTRFFFPQPARRFIAFIGPGGVIIGYNKITAAVENTDGTETLTLETAMPDGVPAATTMISFLTFARLAGDDNELTWSNVLLAQATLAITELPQEVPA